MSLGESGGSEVDYETMQGRTWPTITQYSVFTLNKNAFAYNELIVVELPSGPSSLADVCATLLQAEINIHYSYPLIVHPHGLPAMALHVDNIEQATSTLHLRGFEILSEADLSGY